MRLNLFIFCVFCVSIIRARLSGIYIDNGFDQTVMQKLLTRQEKREVEHEILNLLGLPTRPRPNIPVHLASSAPKFLMDVYKSLLENSQEHSRTERSEFTLSGRDQQAIDESDVIMSFTAQNSHVDAMRHERGRRLWFDVSEVPVEDSIVGAELRVYQSSNTTHKSKHHSFSVTAYQVIQTKHGNELQFVDAVNTTHMNDDWLIFNLTGPLSTWVAIPEDNLGLYLSVTPQNNPSHEIKPEEIGIIHAKSDEEHQPFMVAFFKSSVQREVRVRQTREANPRRRKKKSDNNPGDSSYSRNPLLHSMSPWSSRSCQKQHLFVSFKDLEWQDWIIAPDGYHAFYCSGECNFPLNAHMNATNHAIVQTLVHLMNPTNVPKPCCAPTKLSAISVLYFLEDSNVILKKYKNMVVKSCGCH